MEQTVIQIGNSIGSLFPLAVRTKLGLSKGDKIRMTINEEDETVTFGKAKKKKSKASDREFMSALKRVHERYGPALAELAHR